MNCKTVSCPSGSGSVFHREQKEIQGPLPQREQSEMGVQVGEIMKDSRKVACVRVHVLEHG